eukprot:scaffold66547_cov36-Phaeocystis_antarctica.AAC.1
MAAGPDAPLAARYFDALVHRGAEASVPREGRRQKKSDTLQQITAVVTDKDRTPADVLCADTPTSVKQPSCVLTSQIQ